MKVKAGQVLNTPVKKAIILSAATTLFLFAGWNATNSTARAEGNEPVLPNTYNPGENDELADTSVNQEEQVESQEESKKDSSGEQQVKTAKVVEPTKKNKSMWEAAGTAGMVAAAYFTFSWVKQNKRERD